MNRVEGGATVTRTGDDARPLSTSIAESVGSRGRRGVQRSDRRGHDPSHRDSDDHVKAVMTMSIGNGAARIGAGLTLALALTACTGSPEEPEPSASPTSVASSTPPVPSASSPTPTSSQEFAATEAYDRFWAAKVQSQADPTKPAPKALRTYGIDKALADAQATVLLLRRNGIVMRGEPTHDARITGVSAGARPLVSITDCLDSSRWLPVVAATGESALAPGQSPRVIVESVATIYDGRWVIKTSTAYRDRSC